jgi:rRNA maturation RNase YbeY
MITYQTEDITLPNISKRVISNWIKTIAQQYDKKIGEIAYIFCSDEYILKINNEYLKHDYYTDIITFDYSNGKIISGDIFISLETVKSNAEKYNQVFETELHRVIIHGILHLCGQKDKTDEERAEMTRKENQALQIVFGL